MLMCYSQIHRLQMINISHDSWEIESCQTFFLLLLYYTIFIFLSKLLTKLGS